MLFAITINALSRQIINGFLAILDRNKWIGDAGEFPGIAHEENIVPLVFSVEDRFHQEAASRKYGFGNAVSLKNRVQGGEQESQGVKGRTVAVLHGR